VSETQVVLELTGILVYQLVRGVGCLDLGQAREEQAWLQGSHAMTFIEVQIVQVTHIMIIAQQYHTNIYLVDRKYFTQ